MYPGGQTMSKKYARLCLVKVCHHISTTLVFHSESREIILLVFHVLNLTLLLKYAQEKKIP